MIFDFINKIDNFVFETFKKFDSIFFSFVLQKAGGLLVIHLRAFNSFEKSAEVTYSRFSKKQHLITSPTANMDQSEIYASGPQIRISC